MTKSEIDKYVTHNYDWLIKIAKSHIYKNNRRFSAEELVTNLYEYLLKKKSNIPDKEIEIYSSRFIVTQCAWNNSETNKETFLERHTQGKVIEGASIPDKENIDDDIQEKIEIEKWYNTKQYLINSYRQTIEQKEEQIFFDVYFSKLKRGEKVTVRAIAKHFKISSTPTYHLIKQMHFNLKTFEQNQKL